MIDPKNYNHKLYDIAVEGKSGDWELKKELIPPLTILDRFDNSTGTYYQDVSADFYPSVRLYYKSAQRLVMMANKPSDHEDHQVQIDKARGKVLTSGLGLGLFPLSLMNKLETGRVSSIDIVEKSYNVIELIGPSLSRVLGNKIRIINADIREYLDNTNLRYDFTYIDIWPSRWEAVAEGPHIMERVKRVLNSGGEAMFWTQGVYDKLSRCRGWPNSWEVSRRNEPCKLCGIKNHSHQYGYLCAECADAYEAWLFRIDLDQCILGSLWELEMEYNGGLLEEFEDVSSRRLASKLGGHLGVDIKTNLEVVRGLKPDIWIESKNLVFEAKKHLGRIERRELESKIREYMTKTDYKLVILIYWDCDAESLISFWEFIIGSYPDRVSLVCWGDLGLGNYENMKPPIFVGKGFIEGLGK